MSDRHFDQLATRFAEKIYGGAKGAIRLAVLQADLVEALPQRPLRVLDIGAGLGHMSLWLAEQGHEVTLAEPAAPMLEGARQRLLTRAKARPLFMHRGRTCSASSPSLTIWCCAMPCWSGWPSPTPSYRCCTN